MKTCSVCGVVRDTSEFRNGRNQCKICLVKYNREYGRNNWQAIMVDNSRWADKLAGRTATDLPYITTEKIDQMWTMLKGKCFYCDITMKTGVNRATTPDAVTLERVNNDLPHYSDNCVLACSGCNITRGNSYTFKEFSVNWKEIETGLIRKCSICKLIKTRDEFGNSKTLRFGIQHRCIICTRIYNRNYRKRKRNDISIQNL